MDIFYFVFIIDSNIFSTRFQINTLIKKKIKIYSKPFIIRTLMLEFPQSGRVGKFAIEFAGNNLIEESSAHCFTFFVANQNVIKLLLFRFVEDRF